jgi:hypothetical protein
MSYENQNLKLIEKNINMLKEKVEAFDLFKRININEVR